MVKDSSTEANSVGSTVNDQEDVKTIDYTEQVERYPSVLESAPFPALASLDEITQTLSKIKSTNTQKSAHPYKEDIEEENVVFKQEAYPTEGIRNPGWMSVISCFLVNFFVFGTTFSWGNYQNLYLKEVYAGQTNLLKISFIGTSATALMMALGLFITPVIQRLGFRGTMVIGTVFVPVSLILASFATQLWHIYLSQGILYGMAAAFVFSPSVTLPSQWFTARRSLATGIAVSGSGIGGVCLSPMIENLIRTVGYRNTLRIEGCFGFAILCIATALATSRYRPPRLTGDNNKWYHMFDRSLLTPRFILLLCFGFFVPFGYIAPFFLAPQFVQSLGLDSASGAAMISVMSAANAICRISLGYLADRVGRFNTLFLFTFFSGFFTMVIWQNAKNYAAFAVYCVLFGLTAGGFVSLLPVTTADIVGVENIQRGLGMAYMTTVLGNLLGTPIIGLLFNSYGWTASIQFAGSLTVTASLFVLVLRLTMTKGKIFVKI